MSKDQEVITDGEPFRYVSGESCSDQGETKMSLFKRVKDWGYRVGIFEENNVQAQYAKLLEELSELYDAVGGGTDADITEEIGDCLVMLNILCHMTDNVPDDCLRLALNKIEKRKGKIINGVFVKD